MAEIELINNLEKISSGINNRILIIEGYFLKENHREKLEIIIFKGFSSSTTHQIEIDLDKKVVEFSFVIKNFKLYKSPLKEAQNNLIRENQSSVFFLNKKNWI